MAPRLASTGQSARLIVLDTGRDVDLPKIELVEASYRDFASMRQALAGVHTFFMIPVHEAPDRVQQHVTAVDAAVAASVKRIVYSSFVGASPDATFTFVRDHWHTEEHIRSTDLDFTFLRGNVYLDVLPWIVGTDGFIRGPVGDGHVAAVARDDVADAAVSVLLGENPQRRDLRRFRTGEANVASGCGALLAGRGSRHHLPCGDDRGGVRGACFLRRA